tara:strand:- start:11 stop:451 length:441 start_codon:yes stop_codon:yes gene_type:complete
MDNYKVLKNETVTISGTPQTVTYQVPPAAKTQVGGGSGPVPSPLATSVNTQSLVTSLYVCNTSLSSVGPVSFDVNVSNYDASSPVVTGLYNYMVVGGKTTYAMTLNLTLKESDELRVVLTQVGAYVPVIDVTIFGIEMVTGVGPHA